MGSTISRGRDFKRWLLPLLAVYAAFLFGSGIALLSTSICNSSFSASVMLWFSAPLIVALGFFFAVTVLIFFDTVPLIIMIFGLGILAANVAVLGLSARASLRGNQEGRWPIGATLLLLSAITILSCICTVSACLTATI